MGSGSASIFPADDAQKWGLIVALVEGLVTGEARVALYRPIGWSRPYRTVVQLRIDGRWTNVSTGLGCAIPPIVRQITIRNPHPTTIGIRRPAFGSAAVLLFILAISHWIMT